MSFSGKHHFGRSDSFDELTDEEKKEHGGRPNRFLYTGKKQKTGPWGEDDSAEFTEIKTNFPVNNKPAASPSEFDLDDVWSIRRNVQVNQNVKKGPTTDIKSTTKPSFYSRHSGFIGNGDIDHSLGAKRTKRDTASDYKSWNTQSRTHYSYSDQLHSNTANEEFDFDPLMKSSSANDESFVTRKNQSNICHTMPGAPQPAVREMSARTQRAHKLQQAQHKSMGLGQFVPGQNPYYKQRDENENKVKWKKKGGDFI